MNTFRKASARLAAGSALLWAAHALAQVDAASCGPVANSYGPYDYRVTGGETLGRVDGAHFPPMVEALIRGKSSYYIGGDIDYTLRAFPNHHRALIAVMRYGEKMKSPQPSDLRYPVECYFERALRFQPDDTIVRMIYAQFLSRNARLPEALKQLAAAEADAKDNNGFTHYNIGLIYLELKDYPKALSQAHKASSLGFPRTELKSSLQAAGKWTEPPAQAQGEADESVRAVKVGAPKPQETP